jgi:hypothetical protein
MSLLLSGVTFAGVLLLAAVPGVVRGDAWAPLLGRPLPDPYVFGDEGYYYITGTAPYGYCGTKLDPEVLQPFAIAIDFGDLGGPYQHWGFKYYRHADGAYHAYATVHFGGFVTAVAHLTPGAGAAWRPGAPITAWRVDRLLVGDRHGERGLAYDAEFLRDTDGQFYLLYNFSEARHSDVHIMAQRMLDPATPDPSFRPRRILSPEGYRSEDRNPGYIQIVEATNVARVQGTHVLLYSVGDFMLHEGRSNYKLGVAFSDTLIPPEGEAYAKALAPDRAGVWGPQDKGGQEVCYLLQSQHAAWRNYCAGQVIGPGLGNIVEADGQHWLVFHGYRPGEREDGPHERYAWKLPLRIEVRPGTPRCEWIRPVLPGAAGTARGNTAH